MNYQSYLQVFQSITFPGFPAPVYRVQENYGGVTLFKKDGEPVRIEVFGPKRNNSHKILLSILLHEDGHILADSPKAYEIIRPLLKIDGSPKDNLLNIFEDYRAEKQIAKNYPSVRHILPLHSLEILLQSGKESVLTGVLLLARAAYSKGQTKRKLMKIAKIVIEKARGKEIDNGLIAEATAQFGIYSSYLNIDPKKSAKAIERLVEIFPEILTDSKPDGNHRSFNSMSSSLNESLREMLTQIENEIVNEVPTPRGELTTIPIPTDKAWDKVYTEIFGTRDAVYYGKSGTMLDPLSLATPRPVFIKKKKVYTANGKKSVALLIDFSGSTDTTLDSGLTIYQMEMRAAKAITKLIEGKGGKVTWIHFSSSTFVLREPNTPIPREIRVEFSGTVLTPAIRLAHTLSPDTILVLTDAHLSRSDWEFLNKMEKMSKIAVFYFSDRPTNGNHIDNLYQVTSPRTLVVALKQLRRKGII